MSKKNKDNKKGKEEDGEKKKKLKPGFEIIKRLQYDPQYDMDQITVVYLDRFIGPEEADLEDFIESDVPNHRLQKIKINGHIVWDRELREDLVSDGTALQFLIRPGEEESDEKKKEKEGEMGKEIDTPPAKKIVFSKRKNRDFFEQYEPKDNLEGYMIRYNQTKVALIQPTHVSQRGGYYHILDEHVPRLFKEWETSIMCRDVFFMEEFRTSVFRLYLDFDFKTTDGKPYKGILNWLPDIQYCVNQFFGGKVASDLNQKLNSNVIVCSSHSKWKDGVTKDANYKSGYRFFYTFIYVDQPTMLEFTKILCDVLRKKFSEDSEVVERFPKGWKFENIVDLEQVSHEKVRMIGTHKSRRGKNLGRVYKFMGYFNGKGMRAKKFENCITLPQILFLTSVRDLSDDCMAYFPNEEVKKLKVIRFTEKEVAVGKALLPRLEKREKKGSSSSSEEEEIEEEEEEEEIGGEK